MMRTITKAVAIAAVLITVAGPMFAAAPQTLDLTSTFRGAGATIDRLQVFEVAGIVLIRGRATSKAQAEQVGLLAHALGYSRVANLVQIVDHDDLAITRQVERELTANRSLDGCQFSVQSVDGVVSVNGRVQHELQKDVAFQILRGIDGVRSVNFKLDRF